MGRVKANWKLKSFSMAVGSFARALRLSNHWLKVKTFTSQHTKVCFSNICILPKVVQLYVISYIIYCIIVSIDDFSYNLSKSWFRVIRCQNCAQFHFWNVYFTSRQNHFCVWPCNLRDVIKNRQGRTNLLNNSKPNILAGAQLRLFGKKSMNI